MKNKTYDTDFAKAETYLNDGHIDQAIKEFQDVVKRFPADAKCYSKLGACFACQKRFKQAKEYIEKAINLNPKFSEPYNNLGNIFLEEKNYKKAVELYEKAINLNPDYAAAHSNLGLAYKKLNQYVKAVRSFKKAAEIDRKTPTVKVKEIMNKSKIKINFNLIIFLIIGLIVIWFLFTR
ncbi:MAG: tetratricopeptide repeat protein [Candidatus Caldatribacteriota bacterium]|nr:tetratricopeptide repeat protein [Candidatus Caldatribacteriota bacterium]